jgi:arylsulfatase A-like enzyme
LSALEVFAASSPNVVLITIDSARTDRMGFLGGKAGLTPNLDRLANESMVFDHAYAQAPGTVLSHASLLTGTYPQATGMSEIGGTLSATVPYLPYVLKNRGYRTAAFVGSIELDPHNGLAQGFDRGFSSYDAGFLPVIPGDKRAPVILRRGDEVAKQAATWITKNSQAPFFVWVHISDPGAPVTSNNTSILSADAAVGKLITTLKDEKLYPKTAIFVAADYGESLGAHGEDTHGIFLYDETIHIPLLMKMPDAQPGAKHVSAKVRLVDVAPTVLEISGLPVPSQMLGQSLLRAAKSGADQAVYSRTTLPQRGFGWSLLESWRAGKYLYIRAPKPELYDLTADPGATHNLAQSSKATLDTMASQLDAFDRRFGEGAKAQSSELSSSEMQKLASLGYVGLQKSSGAIAATGTDPKDKISIANNVVEAARSAASKPDRAITALQPVVSGDANLYLAQFALGVALAQKGQFAEAAKHLHKAIELQPDSAWAHFEIGACLLKTGDLKTAAVHLEIAAGRLTGFAPARQMLATTKK